MDSAGKEKLEKDSSDVSIIAYKMKIWAKSLSSEGKIGITSLKWTIFGQSAAIKAEDSPTHNC